MMKGVLNFIGGALLAAVIIAMTQNAARRGSDEAKPNAANDTITVTTYDTIALYKPVPRDSIVLRYETARLPISMQAADTAHSGENRAKRDSADVAMPISQVEAGDSLCHIWASGYRVVIDSVYVYPRREVVTIKGAPKRWHIGPTIGYGITPHGFQPYVGVSVTYSIFTW